LVFGRWKASVTNLAGVVQLGDRTNGFGKPDVRAGFVLEVGVSTPSVRMLRDRFAAGNRAPARRREEASSAARIRFCAKGEGEPEWPAPAAPPLTARCALPALPQ
jgi:hypothetical protein